MATDNERMYEKRKSSLNFFSGCLFQCSYCRNSFQMQSKRQKPTINKNGKQRGCQQCYDYTPHPHLERLNKSIPKTRRDEFIWCCSMGDISFAQESWINQGIEKIKQYPDRTFFFQTKDPKCYEKYIFPENCILGITLESNIDKGYSEISNAPLPTQRYHDFLKIKHPKKTITIEPIIKFNFDIMITWIKKINPLWVWVGYDSHKSGLPEPSLTDTYTLIKTLQQITIIKPKLLREKVESKQERGILAYC